MEREGKETEERKERGKERRDSPVFLITEGGHCLWDGIHLLHSAESHFHSDSLFTFKTLFISLSVLSLLVLFPCCIAAHVELWFHWYHVATKSSLLCSAAQHKSYGVWGRVFTSAGYTVLLNRVSFLRTDLSRSSQRAGLLCIIYIREPSRNNEKMQSGMWPKQVKTRKNFAYYWIQCSVQYTTYRCAITGLTID